MKTNITTYLVRIKYDGSSFAGWAMQPKIRTVQGELNQVLSNIFSQTIIVNGTSRTDALVHALDQGFIFSINANIAVDKMKQIIERVLPSDIGLISVITVPNDYSIRLNILNKEYRYYINTDPKDPFKARYRYDLGKTINLNKLQEALSLFVGKHYFYNFSGLKPKDEKNPYRTVISTNASISHGIITIAIIGDGFLRYQVRYIVGASINFALGKVTIEDLKRYLNPICPDKYPYEKAPGNGLYLYKTTYK